MHMGGGGWGGGESDPYTYNAQYQSTNNTTTLYVIHAHISVCLNFVCSILPVEEWGWGGGGGLIPCVRARPTRDQRPTLRFRVSGQFSISPV